MQGSGSGSGPASAEFQLQQLLSTPPPDFTGNPQNHHAVAHASLQALRDAGDEQYLFLRTILEQTAGEELLFHCITGCRHVLLWKWTTLSSQSQSSQSQSSSQFQTCLTNFFMVLGDTQNVSRTIQLACYNTSASFWKRQWNETKEGTGAGASASTHNPTVALRPEEQALLESLQASISILMQQQQQQSPPSPSPLTIQTPQDLFQYLQEKFQNPQTMSNAASFLSVLVGEFAGKSASNYRMPLEFHKRAHATFESQPLEQALQMSIQALSQVVQMMLLPQQQQQQQQQQQDNNHHQTQTQNVSDELAVNVVQVTMDIIGWEFGTDAWDAGTATHKTLIRPPVEWRQVLMQPEFCKAVFHVHKQQLVAAMQNNNKSSPKLGHGLRQLLLLLASLSGPIFQTQEERQVFATYLLDGSLEMLQLVTSAYAQAQQEQQHQESSELLDTLSLISRLIANFKLSILVQLPQLPSLLQGMASIGRQLLQDNLRECEAVHGDLECMEHREWREEALVLLLEGVVLLCGDPWLLYSGSEESRKQAQSALARTLAPLYAEFVTCRTRMARLEEHYLTAHETELDEVREDIFAVDLEEEMASLANVGRLDLSVSLGCLSALFQNLVPHLKALWDGNELGVSPDAAGMLEESRLVTMYIGHLLTDDNTGEAPVIPDAIIISCEHGGPTVTRDVSYAVQMLLQFAEAQASKIAANPMDPRLSPLLAKAFLWFLNRWAPAYILPADYGASSKTANSILNTWSTPEAVQQTVSFCITLCLHYQCYWPHERQVQESSALLLLSLAKRCNKMRSAMVASPSFRQMLTFHCLTAGIRHSAPPAEFESTVRSQAGNSAPSMDMVRGYQRLPYDIKSKILTGLLVGCSELEDQNAKAMLNDCLKAIHDAFSSLVHVLANKQADPDHVDAKEMACLCVELYGGVARAADMEASSRIPTFITPSLPHLSGLMAYYAKDLSICESLLRLFRDYSEQFIAVLDPPACMALFQSSAELLKSYSANHCASRVITHSVEEEQNYSDVLCAIQLLIQLGTKDFIDIGGEGMDSAQVTDMIFFGLQQILPLMTQGLLQFPTLCSQYFSLVGFMMETYPEKVGALPYELFDALFESLLFGMSHYDTMVGKTSLQGLSGIIREHLKSKVLDVHLSTPHGSGLLDKCSRRLLLEVVFQSVVWDRLESAAMTLLPLAAVDLTRFGAVVQHLTQQVPVEHQQRLSSAFEALLQHEILSKVSSRGNEGRHNRIRFKKDFENFCHDIHSFLVIK